MLKSDMINLSLFIFLSIISLSYGCFPTPEICTTPTLVTGDMFECPNAPCFIPGPLGDVAINSLSVTAPCCQYSATCTNPLSTMQFNNNADSISYPVTVTCDPRTSLYTYNNAGVRTQILYAQCCPPSSCDAINNNGEVDNAPSTLDASCTYHRILSCTNGMPNIQINNPPGAQTGPGFPGPETLPSGTVDAMCRRGAPKYVHNSPMFGPSTTIGRIRCP